MAHDHCDNVIRRPEGMLQWLLAPFSITWAGLLTHVPGSWLQGFSLYVDGQLNATSKAPQAFWHTDGGDPIMTEAPIVLCGRSDHASSSGFNGKLAALSVWDRPLSSDQVRSLWKAAQSRSAGGSAILASAPTPGPQPGSASSSPSAAPNQAPATPSSPPSSNPTQSGAPPLACSASLLKSIALSAWLAMFSDLRSAKQS